jgi:hypothetical protein
LGLNIPDTRISEHGSAFLKAANVSKKGALITINGRLKNRFRITASPVFPLFSGCEMSL